MTRLQLTGSKKVTLTNDELDTLHAALIWASHEHTRTAERLGVMDNADCQTLADEHAADARRIDALDLSIRRQALAGFKLLVDGVEITRAQSVTIDVDVDDVDVAVSGRTVEFRSACGDVIPPF